MILHLPNILTLSRVGMAVVFVLLYLSDTLIARAVGVLLVIGSIITDYWDGRLARQNKLVSDFGKIADPLTDSILYISIFACFSFFSKPAWMPAAFFWIVAAREFLMHAALRPFMLTRHIVVSASMPGKVKTVMQCIAAITAMVFMVFLKTLAFWAVPWLPAADTLFRWIVIVLLIAVVFFSLYSFFLYILWSIRTLREQ